MKRIMDEVNNTTDLSEVRARTYRSVCVNQLLGSGQGRHLACGHGDGKADVSARHHGVENGKEMRAVLVGQVENGADHAQCLKTQRSITGSAACRAKACHQGIVDTDGNRVVKRRVKTPRDGVWHSYSVGHEEHDQRLWT